MTVQLDTSALVDSIAGERRHLSRLLELVGQGVRLELSALVLYEWQRGPRTPSELRTREELFPNEAIRPFDLAAALAAATLYQSLPRARRRETDIAVAACALVHDAGLWTLNRDDFDDIPGLRLL